MGPKVFLVLLVLSLSLLSFSSSPVHTTAPSSTPQDQNCTTKEGVKYKCKEGQPIPQGSNDTHNHQFSGHDKPSGSPIRQGQLAYLNPNKPATTTSAGRAYSNRCDYRRCNNG